MEKSLSDREVIEKHAMLSVGRVIQSWNKSGAWYNKSFHIFVRGFMWLLVPKPDIKTSEHYYCSILLMY